MVIDIDLVRIYHPDSPVSRALPPELTDGRFQAITKAYDALRGKTVMTPAGVEAKADHDIPQSAAWRRHRARRLDLDSGGDDRWKERLLILGAVFTAGVFVFQALSMRQKAIAQMQQSPYTYKERPIRKREDRDLDASNLDAKK
ncbi:hypothetical protein HWV62_9003 [Athelia sp. TMB]|nr:hypothetical protein HWV62_9003 [Athelia sp. TMB]